MGKNTYEFVFQFGLQLGQSCFAILQKEKMNFDKLPVYSA